MRSSTGIRALLFSALPAAWLALPSLAQTTTAPTPPPSTATAPRAPHRAEVSFAAGRLTVQAQNASLNQLIREIARQTGMHVSGSVAEDRVFGSYGPADPSRVLSMLLDGTGSNLLIVQNAADRPTELILTPRIGAPTPPNPNAAADSDPNADDDQDTPITPIRRGGPPRSQLPPNAPQYNPAPQASTPATQPAPASSNDQTVAFPQVGPNATPATASTTDNVDSTDKAVKTPQQIFEELQKLQQQTPK